MNSAFATDASKHWQIAQFIVFCDTFREPLALPEFDPLVSYIDYLFYIRVWFSLNRK